MGIPRIDLNVHTVLEIVAERLLTPDIACKLNHLTLESRRKVLDVAAKLIVAKLRRSAQRAKSGL